MGWSFSRAFTLRRVGGIIAIPLLFSRRQLAGVYHAPSGGYWHLNAPPRA